MVALPEHVEAVLRAMRDAGVLSDMCGNRLNADKGVILVACADGDQMFDLFTHQAKIMGQGNSHPRLHTLTMNGGGLVIAHASPLNRGFATDGVMIEQISGGRALKGIDTIAIYSHFPCGMAAEHGLPALEQLKLLVQAKDRLKRELAGVRVSLFLHVNWQDEHRRTYHLSRKRFGTWLRTRS